MSPSTDTKNALTVPSVVVLMYPSTTYYHEFPPAATQVFNPGVEVITVPLATPTIKLPIPKNDLISSGTETKGLCLIWMRGVYFELD